MSPSIDEAGQLLRSRGMRSTPQRRALLAAFDGGPSEHLAADDVFARAARELPDLSRGTVYATPRQGGGLIVTVRLPHAPA